MEERKGLTLLLVSEDGRELRSLRLTRSRVRTGVALGVIVLLVSGVMAGTWWFFALRSLELARVQERVARLEAERSELLELATTLDEVEREYARLRNIFGTSGGPVASDLWLPPPAAAGRRALGRGALDDPIPDSWPLTEPGYVTQNLLAGASGDHPGIDIAIAADSYVRAAGAGRVVEAGRDSIYGNVVVVDHGNGYRSRYAHASLLFVDPGQAVRKREVIALSGNTGRSTAPHLHFEILREGEAVDPFTLVTPPGS
jgi:murein DD-endopeptidase MepM/ murein hydrolase activator NlpD